MAVTASGVWKGFGPLEVLRGLDLDIAAGEKLVLIGASGCGKSTFLRCVNALESIDRGTLSVDGTDLSPGKTRTDVNALRARVGIVFQQFNLFPHLTVLENLVLGPVKVLRRPKDEAVATARDWLARVGIAEKARAFPDQLSGGQQQRVAIARSLAMAPRILLFDEPTSALDPQMTREVLAVIREVAKTQGMTMIIVTHELRFAEQVADRVVMLHAGRVVESGPPQKVFQAPQAPETRNFLSHLAL